ARLLLRVQPEAGRLQPGRERARERADAARAGLGLCPAEAAGVRGRARAFAPGISRPFGAAPPGERQRHLRPRERSAPDRRDPLRGRAERVHAPRLPPGRPRPPRSHHRQCRTCDYRGVRRLSRIGVLMPRLADWSLTPLLLLAPLAAAAAQGVQLERPPRVGTESVTVAADSSHAAGPLHRFFFGSGYRDLWVTPITVPVLDLERFDGGLTATESGGGMQTKSLRLENDEGFEWTFRSVAKDARSILPEKLRNSFMVGIVNDQISHAHPGGALVVPPLASAIGILHAQPQLAVMPDVPELGEFRETYGGMLGIIEEFMDDLPDGEAGFAGSDDIVNSGDLLEELRQDPSVRIDAHDFLKARLLDLVINDWDRHRDQWRWAKLERRGGEYWVPIPRDRDNALFWFDRFFPSIARMVAPKLLPFGSRISLKGLTVSSRDLDPVILAPLDRREWDSLATFVMERLTDSLIMAAEAGIPPEYRPEREELVAGRLISRR